MDWEEKENLGEEKEEERKEQDKEGENFPVYSDWDADLEEQDRKNQELENRKNKDRKTLQTGPNSSSVDTFTDKPSTSSIEHLGNLSSAS